MVALPVLRACSQLTLPTVDCPNPEMTVQTNKNKARKIRFMRANDNRNLR